MIESFEQGQDAHGITNVTYLRGGFKSYEHRGNALSGEGSILVYPILRAAVGLLMLVLTD